MFVDIETSALTALPKICECFALGFKTLVLGPFEALHLYITLKSLRLHAPRTQPPQVRM